ncbi:MAG: hypothetical protein HN427_07675 [Flavobacteriales bacterium]|nr:hypothetical protein [Flavobacteriales bacterium]MBT7481680.1 hypothetical protein [Flavobacteriales bacterium]
MNKFFLPIVLCFGLFFMFSCEKESTVDGITSNDGSQARKAYTEKGYTEVEVSPIVKSNCYFQEWDKEVLTPVSGLFEYYDSDNNWVASINFGDGSCNQWATKTWDVNMFPDYPSGSEDFSVFDYKPKN